MTRHEMFDENVSLIREIIETTIRHETRVKAAYDKNGKCKGVTGWIKPRR